MQTAVMESPRTDHLLGPLDEPGFTFTATGLTIDPDVTFEQWEKYGRKLQLADKGIQWALGDWVIFGEGKFKERATQAVEFSGLKVKTLQNYATVAKAVDKSRRRDSDVVDFSTHAEVAMLPDDEQERILAKAEGNPVEFTSREARKEARRSKRKLGLIPDETDLLHTEEVQTFLDGYIEILQGLDAHVPPAALFLRNMIQAHIGQAQWQKERTIESDCGVVMEAVEETLGPDDEIFMWLINRGYFMSDPDLDERLELMCANKQIYRVKQGGRKDTQRGDMVTVYHPQYEGTGDAVNVARANSIYSMGERE